MSDPTPTPLIPPQIQKLLDIAQQAPLTHGARNTGSADDDYENLDVEKQTICGLNLNRIRLVGYCPSFLHCDIEDLEWADSDVMMTRFGDDTHIRNARLSRLSFYDSTYGGATLENVTHEDCTFGFIAWNPKENPDTIGYETDIDSFLPAGRHVVLPRYVPWNNTVMGEYVTGFFGMSGCR